MDLVILERLNHRIAVSISDLCKFFRKGEEVSISNYLDQHLIVFLDEATRNDALETLVERLHSAGKLFDKASFYEAVLNREKIVSTGIGLGVAIPHAKLEEYSEFFIVIGIQKGRGIDWNALDGSFVRLIFLIGGPDNKQTEYLKILSRLTTEVKDEEKRKKLFKAKTADEVIELFKDC